MSFNLNLEFVGLCALAKKSDGSELQILLPDGRVRGMSYGAGGLRNRFFVHTPYVLFDYSDLSPSQRPYLDYVSKDAVGNPQKGALILQNDVLGLGNYQSSTNTLDLTGYRDIPEMKEIYSDRGGVSIDPRLTADHNNVNGLAARMSFNKGVVTTADRPLSNFVFTDRVASSNVDYDKGHRFCRKVIVTLEITSGRVDLLIGASRYTFIPTGTGKVTILIANMPPSRLVGDSNDLTVLDTAREDYDFELVYSIASSSLSGKPRVPIKSPDQTTLRPPITGNVGLPPGGTRPPAVCSLAGFNDF